MFDPSCVHVRALGACAVSGGRPISKSVWSRLVGLGSPIGPTLRQAAKVLEEAGTASVHGEFFVVGAANGTLREIVGPYLLDEAEPKTRRMHLRRGLSSLLDLDRAELPVLIDASRETPLREASSLPDRIRAAGERRGLNPQGVRSRALAACRALEAAIVGGRIPGFAFPVTWLEAGGEDSETSTLLRALADLWVSGKLATVQAVVDRTGLNPGSFYKRIKGLLAAGQAEVRETWRGSELVVVNLRRVDRESVSLADALKGCRPDDGEQIRYALKALRRFLGLPVAGALDVDGIREAARAIPLDDLPHLPQAVKRYYLDSGGAPKTARNAASAIRALLREACVEGRIPMVWAERLDDEWTRARDAWFPTTPGTVDGAGLKGRLRHRWAWSHIREAVSDLCGPKSLPADLDKEGVAEIVRWLRRRGRWDHAQFAHTALAYAGRRGCGPFAGLALPENPFLQGRDEESVKTLDGFLACLRANGLGGDWEAFFRWYHRYSTTSSKELRGQRNMPSRPNGRRLRGGSFAHRFAACRLVLGILRQRGYDIRTLTPEDVFSVRLLREALDHAADLWDERFRSGDLPSPCGSSIRSYVASAGLIAEALYRRERGAQKVAEPPENKPRWGIDPDAEEEKRKTHREQALWDAYRDACALGEALKAEALGFGSSDNTNTTKDVEKVLRATPPKLLDDLQGAYLRLAGRSLSEDGSSAEHHRLITDAFLNGILISTGCRGQEIAHLRLDVHCPSAFSDSAHEGPIHLVLRAVDRKNSARHTVTLRSHHVPAWLRAAYLESRRWMMEQGGLRATTRSFELNDRDIHQHLLVTPTGRAYGSPQEDARATNRLPDKDLEKRVNQLRDRWKNGAGRVLWAHTDWECPVENGLWTLHVIRNAMGYAYYQLGTLDAVNFLGDSLKAIRDAYAGVGSHHISAETAELASKWDGTVVRRAAPEHLPGSVDQLTRALEEARAENARLEGLLGGTSGNGPGGSP